jgi:hypothetical protein
MSVNRGGTAEVLPFVLKDEGLLHRRAFQGHIKRCTFPELYELEEVELRR